MAVKTITITTKAYHTLKALKEPRESFSEVIVRVAGKRSLKEFAGTLSSESATKLREVIREIRKVHDEAHNKRIDNIVKRLKHGSA